MKDQAERLRQLAAQDTGHQSHAEQQTSVAPTAQRLTRVIAVTSGKGGVGKTNFTVNLGICLSQLGKKVLVIDADLGMANVDVVLGCNASHSLHDLIEHNRNIEDVITEGSHGVRFISGGSGLVQMANLSQTHMQHILIQFSRLDHWADVILIDTGAGISRNVLQFVGAADEVVVITTPEPTAITDAYAMMKALTTQPGHGLVKLVINKVLDSREAEDVAGKLVRVSARFLDLHVENVGYIYEDPNVARAIKRQNPFLVSYPKTGASTCIQNIAQKLIFGENPTYSRGLKGFLHKFMEKVW